jgi:excisionase family DNA binding protein
VRRNSRCTNSLGKSPSLLHDQVARIHLEGLGEPLERLEVDAGGLLILNCGEGGATDAGLARQPTALCGLLSPNVEQNADNPHDMTVKEVAEHLHRSPQTIRRMICEGELDAYMFRNREYRITPALKCGPLDRDRAWPGHYLQM